MTVLAMVIDVHGIPAHIQLLHTHGEAFDQATIAAVKQSKFEPGSWKINLCLSGSTCGLSSAPTTARPSPKFLSPRETCPCRIHRNSKTSTTTLCRTHNLPIRTVDADFVDPFASHPWVQVAIVSVMVGADGLPKDVRVRRGLGFGLDKKAEAAVWHYRFFPATQKDKPIAARTDVTVDFAKF